MKQPKFIERNGKKILFIDFSDLRNKDDIYQTIEVASKFISSQPLKSLTTLTTISGMYFNTEIFNAFTAYAKSNTPYVKASAVIGMNGLMQIFYNGFSKVSGRDVRACKSEDEAIVFLLNS